MAFDHELVPTVQIVIQDILARGKNSELFKQRELEDRISFVETREGCSDEVTRTSFAEQLKELLESRGIKDAVYKGQMRE